MNKIQLAKQILTKKVWRSSAVLKKYSPEILIAMGIVGGIGATYLACKATLKAVDVKERMYEDMLLIKEVQENAPIKDYTEKDYKRDMTLVYVQGGLKVAKLYMPAIAVGVFSVGCVLGAHKIMRGRNIALVAAYKAVDEAFKVYRGRVIADAGEEKDKQYKYGITKEKITAIETNAKGKEKEVSQYVEMIDPNNHSPYARFFDESCSDWSKTPEYNLLFLTTQQNHANDLLRARGHLFLNEVYDMLGIPRSQAGAVVGWVIGNGKRDNFVDFGIYDTNRKTSHNFVNGYERTILLDFNVDGVIQHLI